MDSITFYILFIIFIASIIRSAFGFGESLIAVPLLIFFIPINVAVPLSVLVSVTIAAFVVITDWKHIHFESARRLVIATAFGLPLGFLLLKFGDEKLVKLLLGIILILFSLYSLWGQNTFSLKNTNKSWSYGCGFLAGILGGAYGMNGPPLIVYGSLRRWEPVRFRATLHAYFLPASLLGCLGYWRFGLLTGQVFHYFFISLIVVLPAIFLGKRLNHILPEFIFRKLIFTALIGIGILLIIF
jgi:uncharacterized membrane protein YfcA